MPEVVLVINPRLDAEFVTYTEASANGAGTPSELQARLRERYARAVVRRREIAGESKAVWYVYRDGRWTSSSGGAEGERDR